MPLPLRLCFTSPSAASAPLRSSRIAACRTRTRTRTQPHAARRRARRTAVCAERDVSEEQAEIAELASIDRLASSWIGSSITRWEWYERIKGRRARLRDHVKRQQSELTSQLDELRAVLLTLEALLDIGLIEQPNDRISVLGWMLVVGVSFTNFFVAYAIFELFSNFVYGVFPINFY